MAIRVVDSPIVQQAFNTFDKNKDNKITNDEYKSAVKLTGTHNSLLRQQQQTFINAMTGAINNGPKHPSRRKSFKS